MPFRYVLCKRKRYRGAQSHLAASHLPARERYSSQKQPKRVDPLAGQADVFEVRIQVLMRHLRHVRDAKELPRKGLGGDGHVLVVVVLQLRLDRRRDRSNPRELPAVELGKDRQVCERPGMGYDVVAVDHATARAVEFLRYAARECAVAWRGAGERMKADASPVLRIPLRAGLAQPECERRRERTALAVPGDDDTER